MVNLFQSAFTEFLNRRAATFGAPQLVTVGATTVAATDISELSFEDIFVAGGKADAGGFTIQVRKSDLPARPATLSDVTVNGRTMKILQPVQDVNDAVYIITAGDPAAE